MKNAIISIIFMIIDAEIGLLTGLDFYVGLFIFTLWIFYFIYIFNRKNNS